MGIGLNTGEVVVGNIGSEKRAKYGILGRHVNLTGRIESYTVGGQIYASEHTFEDAKSPLSVAGHMVPLTVYEIRGIGAPYDLHLPPSDDEPQPLATHLAIRFQVLQEKDTGGKALAGAFLALSPRGALLQSEGPLAPLDNVKILLPGEGGGDAHWRALCQSHRDAPRGHLPPALHLGSRRGRALFPARADCRSQPRSRSLKTALSPP